MNIVSALFRAADDGWHSLGRVRDDRRTRRHGDSRFLYPPSCTHVHFDASRSRDHDDAAARETTSIARDMLRYR